MRRRSVRGGVDELELLVGEAGQEQRFGARALFAFDEVADLGENQAGNARRPPRGSQQSRTHAWWRRSSAFQGRAPAVRC